MARRKTTKKNSPVIYSAVTQRTTAWIHKVGARNSVLGVLAWIPGALFLLVAYVGITVFAVLASVVLGPLSLMSPAPGGGAKFRGRKRRR